MTRFIAFFAFFIFISSSITAQQGGDKRQQRMLAIDNTLKSYFGAISSNDNSAWEDLVDLTTLGWGTRDSLPWVKDPNMPLVVNPASVPPPMPTPYPVQTNVNNAGPDSLFNKLRLNDFRFIDIETISVRRAMVPGKQDKSPFLKVFIMLKPGNMVDQRVPGDEFRGVQPKDLKHKGAGQFIDREFIKMIEEDPASLNRMLSLKMKRQKDGSFLIIHNDRHLRLAPPPEHKGGQK
ncbi:MAG: hypothetical protein AAF502_13170 [Bacteroidota bacterium]